MNLAAKSSNVGTFDPVRTAAEVRELEDQLHAGLRKAVDVAAAIGERLEQAKRLLPHGQFEGWLKKAKITKSSAHRYRAVARFVREGQFPTDHLTVNQFLTAMRQAKRADLEDDAQADDAQDAQTDGTQDDDDAQADTAQTDADDTPAPIPSQTSEIPFTPEDLDRLTNNRAVFWEGHELRLVDGKLYADGAATFTVRSVVFKVSYHPPKK